MHKVQPPHLEKPPSGMQYRKNILHYSYFLTDKIGQGFSSTVYIGQNNYTKQKVAVKVIDIKAIKDNNLQKQFLNNQLQCIRKINHPNLLKLLDIYETSNNMYIITQYCEGGDLHWMLRNKGKFSEKQVCNIFGQLYAGYVSLLQCGYIHRDIKPPNILIKNKQENGEGETSRKICIADFGIVKKVSQNPIQNMSVGTTLYMAPQSIVYGMYTQKSDVWSMGVMLYQLVYGRPPWKSTNDLNGNMAKLRNQIKTMPILIEGNVISQQMANFIYRCLDRNPKTRMSISEMANQPWMKTVFAYLNKNSNNKNTFTDVSANNFTNTNINNVYVNKLTPNKTEQNNSNTDSSSTNDNPNQMRNNNMSNMMINRIKNITENTNPNARDNRSWLPPKSTSKNINGIKQVKSIANLNPNPIRPTSRQRSRQANFNAKERIYQANPTIGVKPRNDIGLSPLPTNGHQTNRNIQAMSPRNNQNNVNNFEIVKNTPIGNNKPRQDLRYIENNAIQNANRNNNMANIRDNISRNNSRNKSPMVRNLNIDKGASNNGNNVNISTLHNFHMIRQKIKGNSNPDQYHHNHNYVHNNVHHNGTSYNYYSPNVYQYAVGQDNHTDQHIISAQVADSASKLSVQNDNSAKEVFNYLTVRLSYLRYLYKIAKSLRQYKHKHRNQQKLKPLISQSTINVLYSVLIEQIVKNLQMNERIIRYRENMYKLQINNWEQYTKSDYWEQYTHYVENYVQKYKVKLQAERKRIRLTQQQKQIMSKLQNSLIEHIQLFIKIARQQIKQRINPRKFDKLQIQQNMELFQTMQITNNLVKLYNIEEYVCYHGWHHFVSQFDVDELMSQTVLVSIDNYKQFWDILEVKIAIVLQHRK